MTLAAEYSSPVIRREAYANDAIEQAIAKIAVMRLEAEVNCLMGQLSYPDRPVTVSFVNQHAVSLGVSQPGFLRALLASDLLLRDGVAMKALLWARGRNAGLNMNGTDFIPRLLSNNANTKIAFYGTTIEWVEKAAESAKRRFGCRSISVAHGFEEPAAYLALARAERPRVIVLGMGMPKQEIVAQWLRSGLDYPCLIICGGAIFDFLAERFPRAPKAMRRLGLEWLHRLICEPARLWRRYTVGGLGFAAIAFRARVPV